MEERHNLQHAIPDYLTAEFRQTLDEEIRKCAASLHSLNVEESKDMYIHLVNYYNKVIFANNNKDNLLLVYSALWCMHIMSISFFFSHIWDV